MKGRERRREGKKEVSEMEGRRERGRGGGREGWRKPRMGRGRQGRYGKGRRQIRGEWWHHTASQHIHYQDRTCSSHKKYIGKSCIAKKASLHEHELCTEKDLAHQEKYQ